MKNTPVVFGLEQGKYRPIFSLRQISVADNAEILRRLFIDIDKEKPDAVYTVKAELLSEFAEAWPATVKNGEGKIVKRPDDALDSTETIRAFFAEPDIDKEWIGDEAINLLKERSSPSKTFYSASAQ